DLDSLDAAALSVDRKTQKRIEAEARQRLADVRRPYEKKIAAIEKALGPLQQEKAELDAWLGSPEAYDETNKTALPDELKRQGELAGRIAQLEEDWLWASAELDARVKR